MDFHLSFNNITAEEAAAICTSLGNALNKNTSGETKLKEVAAKYDEELKTIVSKYNVPSPAEQAVLDKAAEKQDQEETKVANPKKAKAKKVEEPVKEEFDFDSATEEESKPEITKETIQQHTQKLVKANAANKPKILTLLKTFKVDSISKLRPEDYEKFEAGLTKLDDTDLPF